MGTAARACDWRRSCCLVAVRSLATPSLRFCLPQTREHCFNVCGAGSDTVGVTYVFRFLLMGGRAPSDVPFIELHTCPFHVLTHFVGWGRPGAHHQVAFKYSVVATICVPRISSATYTRSTRDVFISGDFEIERYISGHPHGRCHNYVTHPRCYPSRGEHTAQQCNLNQHAIHSTAVSSAPTSSCYY